MVLPIVDVDFRVFSCRTETLSLQAGEAAEPVTSTFLPAAPTKKNAKRKLHPNAVSKTDLQTILDSLNRKSGIYHSLMNFSVFCRVNIVVLYFSANF
jgi:hypothetical protein